MAVTTFKKELWETAILEEFEGVSLAEVVTTKPSSVEGSKAIFNTASLTTGLQAYSGTVSWEDVNTQDIELVYDTKKYFAFAVDDCDKVQLAGDVMMPIARAQGNNIKNEIDKAIFNEAANNAKAKIGTASLKKDIATPADAYDYIVDLGTKLDEENVPVSERYVIARPEFVNLLAKDTRVIDNSVVLANGVVQGMEVNGMQICKTVNCPANKVIALHPSAVGFGKQIDETEAMRLQNAFKDGIRGLVQFGVKTLRTNGIAVLHYTITA